MRKGISLFLALLFVMTVLVVPTQVFAAETETVKINGVDRLQITNVVEAYDVPPQEGFHSEKELTCVSGAKLSTLEDNAITLVFHTIHDPENGSSSVYVAPDGYTDADLNENGEFMGLPKGGSYTFTERGMYYYHILFEDDTMACGYIQVIQGDNGVIKNPAEQSEETPVLPPQVEVEVIPVVSKSQRIQIEEEWADVDAYNIYDNNYIKLRDFAYYYSLFGTHMDKYFDVTWDEERNAINLVTGKAYTEVGGEGVLNAGVSAQAVLSTSSVYLNGEYVLLNAYTINGNNYFKLRDLCEALDISISWWEVQQTIYINNDYPYGKVFEEIVPDIL